MYRMLIFIYSVSLLTLSYSLLEQGEKVNLTSPLISSSTDSITKNYSSSTPKNNLTSSLEVAKTTTEGKDDHVITQVGDSPTVPKDSNDKNANLSQSQTTNTTNTTVGNLSEIKPQVNVPTSNIKDPTPNLEQKEQKETQTEIVKPPVVDTVTTQKPSSNPIDSTPEVVKDDIQDSAAPNPSENDDVQPDQLTKKTETKDVTLSKQVLNDAEEIVLNDDAKSPLEDEFNLDENSVGIVRYTESGTMVDDKSSHFFAYFLTLMVMSVLFYLLFHNKQRIIALIIEGRNNQNRRSGRGRAKYHKLDNNLEEAMSSTKGQSSFDAIY